jgi:hypothetical protein
MAHCIHKVIGYGIAGITVDDSGKITDDRIDKSGFLLDPSGDDKYHLQNFFERLASGDEKWMVELYSMDYHSALLSECVHFAVAKGKGVLAVCPPNKCHCWSRNDDVIDFCEESACFDRQSHYTFLGHGIPSYRYLMDARNGRRVNTITATQFLDLVKSYQETKSDVERFKMENSLNELACDLKFANIDEASANLVPLVPEIVVEFCTFLRLFRDEKTALSLRPMLLSYWR